ncbi:MAG: thioesterase family protein [Fimbriimonadaceae bacterium]|nr:thioesterase family protein [Chitinophagales bacterium]
MSRIKIDFPERSIFSTQINVRVTDLNYGNHLGNDALLSILHEARIQFLRHFNYTELDIEGESLIMSDAAIQYISEAFYGDQLKIEIGVGDFTRAAFDIFYKVICEERIVAIAKTGMIFYNYEMKKVISIPDRFIDKIKQQ